MHFKIASVSMEGSLNEGLTSGSNSFVEYCYPIDTFEEWTQERLEKYKLFAYVFSKHSFLRILPFFNRLQVSIHDYFLHLYLTLCTIIFGAGLQILYLQNVHAGNSWLSVSYTGFFTQIFSEILFAVCSDELIFVCQRMDEAESMSFEEYMERFAGGSNRFYSPSVLILSYICGSFPPKKCKMVEEERKAKIQSITDANVKLYEEKMRSIRGCDYWGLHSSIIGYRWVYNPDNWTFRHYLNIFFYSSLYIIIGLSLLSIYLDEYSGGVVLSTASSDFVWDSLKIFISYFILLRCYKERTCWEIDANIKPTISHQNKVNQLIIALRS